DRVPVRGAGVVVGGGAGVQGDRGYAGVLGVPGGVQVGEVVSVDAHPHLDGQWHVGAAGLLSGSGDDGAEQVRRPGQHRSPTLAGDLGHRAAEVQVDVVVAVLGDQHPHGSAHSGEVHTVELH